MGEIVTGAVEYPGGLRADGLPAALSAPDRLAALASTGQAGSCPRSRYSTTWPGWRSSVTGCVPGRHHFRRGIPHLMEVSPVGWPYGGREAWQNPVGDDFCYFPIGLNGPFIIEDAAERPAHCRAPGDRPRGVGAGPGTRS